MPLCGIVLPLSKRQKESTNLLFSPFFHDRLTRCLSSCNSIISQVFNNKIFKINLSVIYFLLQLFYILCSLTRYLSLEVHDIHRRCTFIYSNHLLHILCPLVMVIMSLLHLIVVKEIRIRDPCVVQKLWRFWLSL